MDEARAARAEKSFGTGVTKSGLNLNTVAKSSSDLARNSSAKVIATVDITGLLYSGFAWAIYPLRFCLRGEISEPSAAIRPAIGPSNFLIRLALLKS